MYEAFYIKENSYTSTFNLSIEEYDFKSKKLIKQEYRPVNE